MSALDFDYQIIRSARRKTIGLQVKQAQVIVRAPVEVEEAYIQSLVSTKAAWLRSKVNQQLAYQQTKPPPYIDGSPLWVAGEKKHLKLIFSGKAPIKLRGGEVIISLPSRLSNNQDKQKKAVKKALEEWFKAVAHQYIPKKLSYYSELMQLEFASWQIKKYKARWGSCNSRRELSFNSLLLMTPQFVIDYVIVHELCHLKHLNHSSAFWMMVAQYYPEYEQAKTWLKHNQDQLYLP